MIKEKSGKEEESSSDKRLRTGNLHGNYLQKPSFERIKNKLTFMEDKYEINTFHQNDPYVNV